MDEKEILFKPTDLYNQSLKKKYHDAAVQYFEMLTKNSSTDKQKNAADVARYKKAVDDLNNASRKLGKSKGLKAFLIFLVILFFAVGTGLIVWGILSIAQNGGLWYLILIGVAVICGGVGFIVLIAKKINQQILYQATLVAKFTEQKNNALADCYTDMATLNASFDWNMPAIVMEKCTPIIDLDPYFSVGRYEYLRDKFGFSLDEDANTSVVGVLSGNIQGNPFVLEKTFDCDYHKKQYDGSLIITWTTTSYDSKGNSYTTTHTQTLTATVYHDAPFYGNLTKLVYGNEAAPHLSFTRRPSGVSNMNEKDRNKFVERTIKDLDKKAEKAVTSGSQFTRMGNDRFDAMFGGTNRDNEVEFRLLFTPLAQANELALIENPIPYGDDFTFIKSKKVNAIISGHSQVFDYSANPSFFTHYDWIESQKLFVNYCDAFIQGLYFDLAPLISIPLYQMHKSHEYIYGENYGSYLPGPEHEVIANGMDKSCFIPKKADSSLPLILKTSFVKKIGGGDCVNVHSYSYQTTPRTDYVPVRGGDGHMHDVPVHWIQYDRVDADTMFEVRNVGASQHDYTSAAGQAIRDAVTNAHFERGLLGIFLAGGLSIDADNKITSIFPGKKNV